MKFVTYNYKGIEAVGVLSDDEQYIIPSKALGYKADTMVELISELHGNLPEIGDAEKISIGDVKLEAPIPEPHQDVVCLGLNYREHADEAAEAFEAFKLDRGDATYFAKRLNRAVAPGDKIEGHFDICDSLDYEVELAAIIGRDARYVKAEDAADYIFGYTILNDVSARNIQTKHKQWLFGKSLDGFTPMGPCILTAEELGAKPELGIRCYVNGELRQNSNTRNLIFDLPYVIEELSRGMTLKAGTIIATGTPSGVAMGLKTEDAYLKSGDVIRCEIDGIGVLENTVE